MMSYSNLRLQFTPYQHVASRKGIVAERSNNAAYHVESKNEAIIHNGNVKDPENVLMFF